MKTPVLFLVFNQPEVTARVFAAIRAARPERLFVSADGPRPGNARDFAETTEVRRIAAAVDWPCDIRVRYLDENLGCKRAVSSAIDWFFEHVESGIILEYDCLPEPEFFRFSEEMLERYRDDPTVFSITGSNFEPTVARGPGSYYFSRISNAWGWASWRRAWKMWDGEIAAYPEFRDRGGMAALFPNRSDRRFWEGILDGVYRGENSKTWAYPWCFAHFLTGAYCVVPNANLVSNIGFSVRGTNALDPRHPLAALPVTPLAFPLVHPREKRPYPPAESAMTRAISWETGKSKTLRELRRVARAIIPASGRAWLKARMGFFR